MPLRYQYDAKIIRRARIAENISVSTELRTRDFRRSDRRRLRRHGGARSNITRLYASIQ